jgi:hypothetical protein
MVCFGIIVGEYTTFNIVSSTPSLLNTGHLGSFGVVLCTPASASTVFVTAKHTV